MAVEMEERAEMVVEKEEVEDEVEEKLNTMNDTPCTFACMFYSSSGQIPQDGKEDVSQWRTAERSL